MDMVIEGLKDLTSRCLAENPDNTESQCRQWFYKLNPNFKNDTVFQNLYPAVYGVVYCNIKIAEQNKSK